MICAHRRQDLLGSQKDRKMRKKKKPVRRQVPALRYGVGARLTIKDGKAIVLLDRPTLNGFESAWFDAAAHAGLTIQFSSRCPLVVCVGHDGLIKYGSRECTKECRMANGKGIGDFTPPWEKRDKKSSRK